MSIWVVRHGETDGNAQHILQRPDIPLNELGLQQAERVAARLASLGAARIVASDLARARMTAEAIAARTGLPVETTPLLAERNFGDLRGTAYASLPADPFAPDFVPPNGESWDAFHARAAAAFALILACTQDSDAPLIVVTHGLLCRAFAQRHLTPPAGQCVPDRFHNTGITVFDAHAPHRVTLWNCTAHLDERVDTTSGGAA